MFAAALQTPAHATESCEPLSAKAFNEQVVQPSELIVLATIAGFSKTEQPEQQWTRITVKQPLKGAPASPDITIRYWQAQQMPLFNYAIGQPVLLFLRKVDGSWRLTQSKWEDCVPSVTNVVQQGKIYPNFDSAAFGEGNHKPVSVEEYKTYLESGIAREN